MIIGVRKEIKPGETRVALTPHGVQTLLKDLQNIYFLIDHNAGLLSGYRDDDYITAGNGRAVIAEGPEDMYQNANIIIGVKELQPSEYHYLESAKPGTIITCFWHVMNKEAKNIIIKNKLRPFWFEDMDGVLGAMSTITGQMSVDIACHYLRKNFINSEFIGRGLLPEHATITILGAAGRLGQAAYIIARRRFKNIILVELKERLDFLLVGPGKWYESTEENIMRALLESDAVISGIHVPGKENPKPVKEYMIEAWGKTKPQAIFVDPGIDQGGSSDTSRPTTHQNPVYLYPETSGILHYCVANMPGAIPQTSTPALEKALLPNLMELINKTSKEKQK